LRKKLIRWFSKNDNFNKAIREISYNIVRGNVPIAAIYKKKLRPYGKIIRKLAGASESKTRHRLVNQSGGYLQIAVPLLLGLIQALR